MSDKLFQENQKLRQAIQRTDGQIQQLLQEKRLLKKKLGKNKRELYDVCDHDWQRQPPQYQERTSWYCLKCGNYK